MSPWVPGRSSKRSCVVSAATAPSMCFTCPDGGGGGGPPRPPPLPPHPPPRPLPPSWPADAAAPPFSSASACGARQQCLTTHGLHVCKDGLHACKHGNFVSMLVDSLKARKTHDRLPVLP